MFLFCDLLYDTGAERFRASRELFQTGTVRLNTSPELFETGMELFQTSPESYETGMERVETARESFETKKRASKAACPPQEGELTPQSPQPSQAKALILSTLSGPDQANPSKPADGKRRRRSAGPH